jgi:hypothetical protein
MVLSSLEQAAYDNCVELLEYSLPVDGMYYATRDFATITLSTKLETSNARNHNSQKREKPSLKGFFFW